MKKYSIGLDFGTNSVRALLADVSNGDEVATCVYNYESGKAGIITDSKDANVARQNPGDWLKGMEENPMAGEEKEGVLSRKYRRNRR